MLRKSGFAKWKTLNDLLRLQENMTRCGDLLHTHLLGVLGHNLVEVLDILNSHHHFPRDALLGIHNPR